MRRGLMNVKELSLFSGAGGGLLGTKLLGWDCIGYVESDDYCQRIIKQRIEDGIFDKAPIFGDIRAFIDQGYADSYQGMVDVVTGGFPCQPFSVAGKQLAEHDERNMWPATLECIRRVRPRYTFLENVPGLLSKPYVRRIFGDLAESGFDAEWCVLPARTFGYSITRDRLWLVGAESFGSGWERGRLAAGPKRVKHEFARLVQTQLCSELSHRTRSGISDGVANRTHRLRAIGNGQVPAVVRAAWQLLSDETIE